MRRQINARLTPEARRGWDRAVHASGANLAALLEAMGRALDQRTYQVPEAINDEAQAIEREGRKRY